MQMIRSSSKPCDLPRGLTEWREPTLSPFYCRIDHRKFIFSMGRRCRLSEYRGMARPWNMEYRVHIESEWFSEITSQVGRHD